MADDVKVKFGGDFSEVPKGAEQAAKVAGTAMKDWFKDVGKSIVAPIAGFFAADALLGQVKDFVMGMREQLKIIGDMKDAIRKSGADPEEFQRLAIVAQQAGVSMEALGKALNKANLFIAQARSGSEKHREVLKAIFNTTEDLNYETLKSSDVFYRLNDAMQDSSQEAEVLNALTKVFGKTGIELVPIMEKTSSALRKQADEVGILTKSELEAADALDKVIERMERKKKLLERNAAVALAVSEQEADIRRVLNSARFQPNVDPFNKSEEENKKAFKENVERIAKERGVDPYLIGEYLKGAGRQGQLDVYYGSSGKTEEGRQAAVNEVISFLQDIKQEATPAPKIGKIGGEAEVAGASDMGGNPSSGVIGFGNNAQLLLMTDQLDVLKEIQKILENSRSPSYSPDFTKSMVNIKVPPTPTIPNPSK
jgi:hypothetical protein